MLTAVEHDDNVFVGANILSCKYQMLLWQSLRNSADGTVVHVKVLKDRLNDCESLALPPSIRVQCAVVRMRRYTCGCVHDVEQ